MPPVRGRRVALVVAAVLMVPAGLLVARGLDGPAAAFAGDALYAALIYVVVAAVSVRARSAVVAAVATAICAAIEAFQLTGIPAALAQSVPAAALVLGTTFQWTDLLAYLLGAVSAALVDAVTRRAAGSSRGAPNSPSSGARPPHPPGGTPSR
ncbi:DUF2809 domain-containing protein [Leifsonia sp. C5G2]|uniref:ribosomal maturation YjgA family protein n=1 Tax=Leifsonia sp. C5G2 TaxID=2735269 RepID=UPI0015855C57|nr:DUF2809 domain-containing protein [Leifsonia sp. C5G2]NUU07550.1 DUF2809 domain-containing protein [Leifsonia sp. C5G2]